MANQSKTQVNYFGVSGTTQNSKQPKLGSSISNSQIMQIVVPGSIVAASTSKQKKKIKNLNQNMAKFISDPIKEP